VERAEYERFLQQTHRTRRVAWTAIWIVGVACGAAVAQLWLFGAGFAVAVALMFGGRALYMRWVKAQLIRRFPELAAPEVAWHRSYSVYGRQH
jgi:hypothetical protein